MKFKLKISISALLVVCLIQTMLGGCARYYAYHEKKADRTAYKIIGEKSDEVVGMPTEFTIETEETLPFADLPSTPPVVLSLAETLELAVDHSRAYQGREESLYTQALSLASSRHQWAPLFSGRGSADASQSGQQDATLSRNFSFAINKMLATGADLSLSFSAAYFSYLTGQANPSRSSNISASLTQPLLRGFGSKIALENLTQAEREMAYNIRDFVQYRKSFSVRIAQNYFNLLRQKDQVKNEENNFKALQVNFDRTKALADAGRVEMMQVDQAETNFLRGRDTYNRTIERYENALDGFKLELGLPTSAPIEPDPNELKRFVEEGITTVTISVEAATQIALENRLDLMTARESVEDIRRQVHIAQNNLLPNLDLALDYGNSNSEQNVLYRFNDENDSYGAGLSTNFPLDKLSDRNTYRRALISLNAAQRGLDEDIDRIRIDIREALRALDQAEKSYTIQKRSLVTAERRVDSTGMLNEAGKAIQRDVLEAQEDLVNAQNAVTNALVDHYNARLDLALALETLRIDEKGLWQEDNYFDPQKK